MKPYMLCLGLLLLGEQTIAQHVVTQTQQLLNSVINRRGALVELRPLHRLYWSVGDTADSMVKRRGGPLALDVISKRKLAEIISNSAGLDTAAWTTQELDSVIFVVNQEQYLRSQVEIKRLKIADKRLISFYKKIIWRYNNTSPANRRVTAFSRPVFDNSGTYAVIAFDNGYLLSGGGAIILYKRDPEWREVGLIKKWAH
ncbi:hypothetical protein BEN47_04920 [Hymenobacter lapidarius]|uniref:Uncharacterized protein n=1 Tax=Hymenobacter lapidarius TaxID=1908237 RepID=A0A1G1STI1_9BACT|nr:hypothetical protein [Hymenobacter lapidarius]OGX81967.1 hypothetical protein BEN47_04920 [Hymenobacter lapidarius]